MGSGAHGPLGGDLHALDVARSRCMPCNPAVGGTAKGHLVREIDALGGLMGRAIDETGIQFKLLNRSRGPAVWSPRAQADKRVYSEWVAAALAAQPGISWIIGKAGRILTDGDRVVGLELETASVTGARSLIVTTGTFLNGLVHVGPDQRPAGRAGEPPSQSPGRVAEVLRFPLGPSEDGDASAAVAREHRLFALRRGARRRPPCPVLVHHRQDRPRPRSPVICCTRPIGSTSSFGSTFRSRRCSTARLRGSARGIAPRSRTR